MGSYGTAVMGFPVGVYSNETTAQTITSFSILELDFLAKHEGMQKGHHHRPCGPWCLPAAPVAAATVRGWHGPLTK